MKELLIILLCGMGLSSLAAKPNVLLIMSDDLNTALSGYGHVDCKTPHLDRLAVRGVQFDRAYCQFPLCGPSRASMMTGLYPYRNNVLLNFTHFRKTVPDTVTLPQLFRRNGYYTARVSKIYHMGIPVEIRKGTARDDDPESWDAAINITCAKNPGPEINWSPKKSGSQRFAAVYGTEGDSSYADGMAADRAVEMIQTLEPNKPFFLGVGFVRPHVPLIAPQKYFDLYERTSLTIPFAPEDDLDDLDDLPEVIQNDQTAEAMGITTPELHRGLLEAYYASISYMDAQVGKVLDALDEAGLTDNTIIVFASDHGYHVGDHHKFQKRHLFEECTRVPFIISVPWLKEQHGRKSMQFAELVDLYPTLVELAGLTPPESIQGTSLLPLLKDAASDDWKKQAVFTVAEGGGESLRTADWRYTQWGFGDSGCELYDLKNDPGEFTNLADNPEYKEELEIMKTALEKRRVKVGYQGAVTREHADKKKAVAAARAARAKKKPSKD
ncbi:sulfatase [Pontiella agarivorans]|uniref:Sulfatase n=1 Tax=Pontiella agarivorans TaxID=3038953 RepID=A0ABU5MUI5_9BACT|nr:sulfatase [Pontiella agarivorans]MDZ8117835.1 sulfatase [Pontiella agarivorans]